MLARLYLVYKTKKLINKLVENIVLWNSFNSYGSFVGKLDYVSFLSDELKVVKKIISLCKELEGNKILKNISKNKTISVNKLKKLLEEVSVRMESYGGKLEEYIKVLKDKNKNMEEVIESLRNSEYIKKMDYELLKESYRLDEFITKELNNFVNSAEVEAELNVIEIKQNFSTIVKSLKSLTPRKSFFLFMLLIILFIKTSPEDYHSDSHHGVSDDHVSHDLVMQIIKTETYSDSYLKKKYHIKI